MASVPEPKNVVYGLYCSCERCGDLQVIRYVGQTSKGARMRFYHHTYAARNNAPYPVNRWIKKHGVGNISHTVLSSVDDPALLDDEETRWINLLGTLHADGGLNLWPGGGSVRGYKHPGGYKPRGPRSEATKKILSDIGKARTGEKANNAKINNKVAGDIKQALWAGGTCKGVAKRMSLKTGLVNAISSEKTWTHVPWPIGPRYWPHDGRFSPGDRLGENSKFAKLTDDIVRAIRKRYDAGERISVIARDYPFVTGANISMVARRKTWKHVI